MQNTKMRKISKILQCSLALGAVYVLTASDASALDWTIGSWRSVNDGCATVTGNQNCTAQGCGGQTTLIAALTGGPVGDQAGAQAWPSQQWVYDWGVNDGSSSTTTSQTITYVRAACGLSPVE